MPNGDGIAVSIELDFESTRRKLDFRERTVGERETGDEQREGERDENGDSRVAFQIPVAIRTYFKSNTQHFPHFLMSFIPLGYFSSITPFSEKPFLDDWSPEWVLSIGLFKRIFDRGVRRWFALESS